MEDRVTLEELVVLEIEDLSQHESINAEYAKDIRGKILLVPGWIRLLEDGRYIIEVISDVDDRTENTYWTIPEGCVRKIHYYGYKRAEKKE